MGLDLRYVAYGAEAFDLVASLVESAKSGDPMTPVTILAPSATVGLALRRRLASDGVANLRTTTLQQLAAQIASERFEREGRRPSNRIVESDAIRRALHESAGPLLSPVSTLPSTVEAIARTARELDDVPDSILARLAATSTQSKEVVDVVRTFRRLSERRWRYADSLAVARAVVDDGDGDDIASLGALFVVEPTTLRPAEAAFVTALSTRLDVTVVIGLTGDEESDRLARGIPAALGREGDWSVELVPARVTRVTCAPTPDAEVLIALRTLLGRVDEGIELDRIALVHSGADPYPRLIADELARAGIASNGPGVRRLNETLPARMLLGALELPASNFHLSNLLGWLGTGPLHFAGGEVRTGTWERIARQSWVRQGSENWQRGLHYLANRFDEDAREEGEGTKSVDGTDARALLSCILDLDRRLRSSSRSIHDWAKLAQELMSEVTGSSVGQAAWPTDEVLASNVIEEALGSFESLEEIESVQVSLSGFCAALRSELDRPAPQSGRFGRGIFVGPVQSALGLTFDAIWVIGMTDGSFPPRPADDVLIPDSKRMSVDEGILQRNTRATQARRDLFGVMSGAGEIYFSYSAGDPRSGRMLRPSRFLLDALGEFAGTRLFARDVALGERPPSLAEEHYQVIPSYFAAVANVHGAIDEKDYRLAALSSMVAGGKRLEEMQVETVGLARALTIRQSRRRDVLTPFSGDVGPGVSPRMHSTSALETYANCPRKYYYSHLLGLRATPTPEELLKLTALEKGRAMHRILERFSSVLIENPLADGEPADSSLLALERMSALIDEEFASMEERSVVGHSVFWSLDSDQIREDLRRFVLTDRQLRAQTGFRTQAVEYEFGSGADSAIFTIGEREVELRGKIDRIDVVEDGARVRRRVFDYKTGQRVDVDVESFFKAGTRLQMPVYAKAVQRDFGGEVEASYWSLGSDVASDYLELTPETDETLTKVVDILATGIEQGIFPVHPIKRKGRNGDNCTYCEFSKVCTESRYDEWRRVKTTRRVKGFRSLGAEGVDDDAADGEEES